MCGKTLSWIAVQKSVQMALQPGMQRVNFNTDSLNCKQALIGDGYDLVILGP